MGWLTWCFTGLISRNSNGTASRSFFAIRSFRASKLRFGSSRGAGWLWLFDEKVARGPVDTALEDRDRDHLNFSGPFSSIYSASKFRDLEGVERKALNKTC